MSDKIKKQSIPAIILLILFICFLYQVYLVLYKGGTILNGDSLFHVQRIMEIRYAFLHHELPNWLNFQTFLGIGQAVNGMYPDISLWPFVALTMGLSITHQVVAISLMILLLTFVVSALSIKKNMNTDSPTAIYMSIAYTFSGYSLYQFVDEFQPGTGIILIFSFPIAFLIRDIVFSNRINLLLSIKFTLAITLILYSHMLSIVVFALIIISVEFYAIIYRKFKYQSVINMFIGGIAAIISTFPIIYRYIYITRSNIIKPFGQGNIQAANILDMIKSANLWDSRVSLSLLSILCILIILIFWKRRFTGTNIRLLALELWLIILCTTIFPWPLFNKVPMINNLQYTPWRFGIWTSVIPVILLITNFNDKKVIRRKIGFLLAIISLFASCQVMNRMKSSNYSRLTSYNAGLITNIKSKYNSENTILMYIPKPDYYPQAKDVIDKNEYLTTDRKKLLFNQRLKNNKHFYSITKKSINNGSILGIKQAISNDYSYTQLPQLGYRSLKYNITVNNRPVNYKINDYGYICLKNISLHRGDQIKIKYHNPIFYQSSIIVSVSFLTLLIVYLLINRYIKIF